MKVLPITFTPKTVFKSYYKDDGIIGYDDAQSEANRNFIRSHYNNWKMPYQSIYEKEHRLTDYQIKLIIDYLEKNHEMQKIEGAESDEEIIDILNDIISSNNNRVQNNKAGKN